MLSVYTYVLIFKCFKGNNAVISSDCIASQRSRICEGRDGKNLAGNCGGINEAVSRHLSQEN